MPAESLLLSALIDGCQPEDHLRVSDRQVSFDTAEPEGRYRDVYTNPTAPAQSKNCAFRVDSHEMWGCRMSAGIGHNSGPQTLTDRIKIVRLRKVMSRSDLSATEKCVAVWLIVEADKNGSSVCPTADMQQAASVKRRETVFSATKKLRVLGIVERDSDRGQRGRYNILPDDVVDAVVDAYESAKSGTAEPHHSGEKWYGESGPVGTQEVVRSDRTTSGKVVRSERTGTVKAVRSDRTSTVEPHHSRAPTRARIESPTGIYTSLSESPPLPPQGAVTLDLTSGETHVGHRVIVNCETVRHADGHFQVSIPAIECRTLGVISAAEIKQKVTGFALQWGLDIEAGKDPKKVVPNNPLNWICACLKGDQTRDQVADIKRTSAKRPAPTGSQRRGETAVDRALRRLRGDAHEQLAIDGECREVLR